MNEKQLMAKFDKLNRKLRRYFDSFFTDLPVTSIQALVLQYIIVESAKRDIFTKDLEEFLGIQGPSVTSLINNLTQSGYLRRESLAEDRRYKKLVLTEKSREIQDEIVDRVNSYMKNVFVDIPEEDLKVFDAVVQKMTQNAQ